MGRLCLVQGVQHTPPLILPSESLQRAMANICEPPKCSDRQKRRAGEGGAWRGVEYWSHGEYGEAVPCVYACLSGVGSWVMWAGLLMVGVLCLLCWIALALFSYQRLIGFTHALTGTNTQVSWLVLMFQALNLAVSTRVSPQPDASLNLLWPLPFRYAYMHACMCVFLLLLSSHCHE